MLPAFITTASSGVEGLWFGPESAAAAAAAPSGGTPAFDSKAFDAALADTLALLDNAAGLVPSAFAKASAEGDMAARFPLVTPGMPEWVADVDITMPLSAKGGTTTGELELSAPGDDDAFDETTEGVDVVVAAPMVLQPLEAAMPVVVDTPPVATESAAGARARAAASGAPAETPVQTFEATGQRPAIDAAGPRPAIEAATQRPANGAAGSTLATGSMAAPIAAARHAQPADIHPAAKLAVEGQSHVPVAVPAAPPAAVIDPLVVTPVRPEAAAPAVKADTPVTAPVTAPTFFLQVPANAAAETSVATVQAMPSSQTPVVQAGPHPIATSAAGEYRPAPIESAAATSVDRGPAPSADLGGQTPDSEGRPSSQFMRFAAALSQVAASSEDGGRTAAPTFSVAAAPAAPAAAPATAVTAVAAPAPASAHEVPEAENVGRLVQAMRVHTRAGAWEATVHLKPEHFGEVTIAMRVEGKTVTASVQAESAGVRQWLESQEQAVRSGMAEHGLQLERFVVQRDGQQSRREAPQQDARRRQPRRPTEQGERFEIVV